MGDLVRWDIAMPEQSSRGVDERLRVAAPVVTRQVAKLLMRRPAGSRLRTDALTRSVCASFAANNRGEYDVLLMSVHPDSELIPPGRGKSGLGFEPVYRGPEGMLAFLRQWKAGFHEFRYEPREIADPGGSRFAVRVGMIGTLTAGSEIRDEYGIVYTMRDGLVGRMENFYDWEAALAALRSGDEHLAASGEPESK
jgi:ketosteroid isomerase-like protein